MSELPAGRELDALIAEKMMGRDGMYVEMERNSVRDGQWRVTFSAIPQSISVALAPTAPLAICRAALAAAEAA